MERINVDEINYINGAIKAATDIRELTEFIMRFGTDAQKAELRQMLEEHKIRLEEEDANRN